MPDERAELNTPDTEKPAELVKVSRDNPDMEVIDRAGQILKKGGLVAFPTETVYGLGGNALDPEASRKIYAAKGRPSDNPLIVHIAEMDSLKPLVEGEIPPGARALAARFWPGPLTMIFPRTSIVPIQTTGGLESVAVRFPSDPVAQALIRAGGGYVAAPSANSSGRPSPTTAQHVQEDLGNRIDMILDAGPVRIGLESTIVDFTTAPPQILRPGFISLDMLRRILGDVDMDPALEHPQEISRPRAPGMKYRHYAPRARMTIIEGEEESVAAEILKRVCTDSQQGLKTGILAAEEHLSLYSSRLLEAEVSCDLKCAGSLEQEETIAHSLYDCLRAFDADSVDRIYSEAFYTPQLGTAIMNRLRKAAGQDIVRL